MYYERESDEEIKARWIKEADEKQQKKLERKAMEEMKKSMFT